MPPSGVWRTMMFSKSTSVSARLRACSWKLPSAVRTEPAPTLSELARTARATSSNVRPYACIEASDTSIDTSGVRTPMTMVFAAPGRIERRSRRRSAVSRSERSSMSPCTPIMIDQLRPTSRATRIGSMPCGKPEMDSTRERISSVIASTSLPGSAAMRTQPKPSPERERTQSTLSRSAVASSTRTTTWLSMSSGLAPGHTA